MKRPIKFRGKSFDTGKLVYGDLVTLDYPSSIEFSIRFLNSDADEYDYVSVDPDSINQLVGYDKDGNEVYEGDVFIWGDGHKSTAKIFNNLRGDGILRGS